MKKLFTIFCLFTISTLAINAQCGNLYIGGVIDGPLAGGTPKGIQFCATADITDLSIYGFGSANNGGGTDGQEFTFPAETMLAGTCFWVGSAATGWNDWFGYEPCYTAGAAGNNGDDAIELFCSGALVDLLGDQGTDGNGECWEYLDGWAVNNSGGPSTTFDCANWSFSGANALDGESDNATAATPYPNVAQTCPLVATPIELASFTAAKSNYEVELNWSTISEVDNDYFDVQFSNDGINFKSIGLVEGAGTSIEREDYSFVHDAPAKGMNYYRLNQVDFSKANSYSEVAQVEFRDAGTLSINPTLINNYAIVNIDKSSGEKEILVHNLAGTLVSSVTTRESGSFELDLSNLASGTYFVSLVSNATIQSAKVVKQ